MASLGVIDLNINTGGWEEGGITFEDKTLPQSHPKVSSMTVSSCGAPVSYTCCVLP